MSTRLWVSDDGFVNVRTQPQSGEAPIIIQVDDKPYGLRPEQVRELAAALTVAAENLR